jgi:glycosyltransferase involved in cell wall biosynthesis
MSIRTIESIHPLAALPAAPLAASATRALRVLLFTDADVFAGTERHMLDLAVGLRAEGVTVMIGCPTPSPLADKSAASGIRVVSIAKKGLVDRDAIRALRRLLKKGEVDVIHAHNGRTRMAAAIAVRWAGVGRCVATQHFLEPNHTTQHGVKGAAFKLAHRWVNGKTHQFVAISKAAKSAMLRRNEAGEDRICVIPNGIEPPNAAGLEAPQAIRAELEINRDTSLIVCVARLEKEKDIGTLVAAMSQVAASHPNSVCVVAGEGTQEQALRQQVVDAELEKSVRLLGFRSDAMSLIQAADLFVLPSLAEPFGLVLLEAMTLGRAVIATDAGGPREIIEHEQTGLLVPPSNPGAMASAIARLLSDRSAAAEMGRRGLERFFERFTADRMARATLGAYHQAMMLRR